MALETLKDVKEIGGFGVLRGVRSGWGYSKEPPFVVICDDENSLSFQVQQGPIRETGVNGCQVDTIIETAKLIIEGLNKTHPCRENVCAITKLDEALMWLEKRNKDREKRGVEGSKEV